jgi:hypothetical protein
LEGSAHDVATVLCRYLPFKEPFLGNSSVNTTTKIGVLWQILTNISDEPATSMFKENLCFFDLKIEAVNYTPKKLLTTYQIYSSVSVATAYDTKARSSIPGRNRFFCTAQCPV